MDVELVRRLALRDPEQSNPFRRGVNAFRQCYFNPAFGWHIAASCARASVMFPETVVGRNHWLFRAYLWQLNSVSSPAPDVAEAFKLSRRPIADIVKAMLIAGLGAPPEVHLDLVAEKTGISRRTLEAYEILFFNVLDRLQDGAYMSSIVYPQGRLVVYDEDYFETAPISDLMLRAAYDHRDIELVERLSGLNGSGYEAGMEDLRELERELEARFIGTADVMARSGLMNQRSAAMERATALLAARRSSRNQSATEAEPSDQGSSSRDLADALNPATPKLECDYPPGLVTSPCVSARATAGLAGEDAVNDPQLSPALPPADSVESFSEPIQAIWSNKDFDKPVTLVARMTSPGFLDHFLTEDNAGIPASEVVFKSPSSSG